MEQYILIGDELLIVFLNSFPKNELLPIDEDKVTDALYKMSSDVRFTKLFSKYHFDTDGPFPYSKEIDDGFFSLITSQLVALVNHEILITKGLELRFQKFIEPNLDHNQSELVHIFSKEMNQLLLCKKNRPLGGFS